MVWNLFEKIINAVKPSENSEQTEDTSVPVASESEWSSQNESQQPEETKESIDNQHQDNQQY
jgi:hypothetical protein